MPLAVCIHRAEGGGFEITPSECYKSAIYLVCINGNLQICLHCEDIN